MKKTKSIILTLLASAAVVAWGVELNPYGYYSIQHPEWPPMPVPPGTNLTLIVRAGGGFYVDDSHLQYPATPLETNVVSQMRVVNTNMWINTNLLLASPEKYRTKLLRLADILEAEHKGDSNYTGIKWWEHLRRQVDNVLTNAYPDGIPTEPKLKDQGSWSQSGFTSVSGSVRMQLCPDDEGHHLNSSHNAPQTNGILNALGDYLTWRDLDNIGWSNACVLDGATEDLYYKYPENCSWHIHPWDNFELHYGGTFDDGHSYSTNRAFSLAVGSIPLYTIGAYVELTLTAQGFPTHRSARVNMDVIAYVSMGHPSFGPADPPIDPPPVPKNWPSLTPGSGLVNLQFIANPNMGFTVFSASNIVEPSWVSETNSTTDASGYASIDVSLNSRPALFFKTSATNPP